MVDNGLFKTIQSLEHQLSQADNLWADLDQRKLLLRLFNNVNRVANRIRPEKQPKHARRCEQHAKRAKQLATTGIRKLREQRAAQHANGMTPAQVWHTLKDGHHHMKPLTTPLTAPNSAPSPDYQEDQYISTNLSATMPSPSSAQSIPKPTSPTASTASSTTMPLSLRCYVCKASYYALHHFYDHLCPLCADLNFQKRTQTRDLTDYVALVTGGRIKIGFETAVMLLAANATVVVTSRFPKDAIKRFAAHPNYRQFQTRLHVVGLDFRSLPAVHALAQLVAQQFPRLNILVNNAAQTIHRPSDFYAPLLAAEQTALPVELQQHMSLHLQLEQANLAPASTQLHLQAPAPAPAPSSSPAAALQAAMTLAQPIATSVVDEHGQPIDLRQHNTWDQPLEAVPLGEMLEVHTINYVAPFYLTQQLLPLLKASDLPSYVINVSAMEGKFTAHKTGFHPHTNSAKAALNMLTRTSARRLADQGVYMCSVDTGWVTNEYPLATCDRKVIHPPLDEVDGAARVLDPILASLQGPDARPVHGVLFKDFVKTQW
jgi:NAD(P)-dependent dehydrogenase (short-subunit alcohol dehydrogenase family)